nr:hypothetical protein [Solirubrobacterales bacterium]
VLAEGDLTLKKPGGGLPAGRLADLAGRRLRVAVAADENLSDEQLEPPARAAGALGS